MSVRGLSALLVAGWLADLLARTDADVDAGIAAYEAGEHDTALERFAGAQERRGDRPEIALDRGLALFAKGDTQAARTAFERASEAEDAHVRASALYELGNLSFDASEWDAAIASYTECLEARPDHGNAKWNLELALRRKQEEEEKQEKEKQDQEDEKQDDQKQDEQKQDEQKQDEQKQDDQKQDEQKQDEQKQDEQKQDEQKQDEQKQDEQKQDEQKQDEQKQDEQQQAPPQPVDEMDLQRALDRLDEQDPFLLDRPRGRMIKPLKDY
jgi:Ca-activated chloride channel family protein